MAKQGMKRNDPKTNKNDVAPVPAVSGKAKSGQTGARPLIAGGRGKVYHATPHKTQRFTALSSSVIDNDLAIDNIVNDYDMTAADWQDFVE